VSPSTPFAAVVSRRDRGIGGPLRSISAYLMKHPPTQITDDLARDLVEKFISGEIDQ
jgi:myo-inositol-1-phosphate synthase